MKGLDFVNVSIVGLGMTQLAIEGVMFANIMRGPNRLVNLGLFMARPFNMAYQAAK